MDQWEAYRSRYHKGEWRAPVFRDMILADIASLPSPPVVLDIGCGSGFDDDPRLQRGLIEAAGKYIGLDPDAGDGSQFIRTTLEETAIEPESIDLTYAVMVLEHVADPSRFWSKIHSMLRSGGIFWGFTMDARHWFRHASIWSEKLRVKDLYLSLLRGERGVARYANYPTFYRSNSPAQIQRCAQGFRSLEFINFQRVGQLNYYLPGLLRPVGWGLDRLEIALSLPGMILGVRAIK